MEECFKMHRTSLLLKSGIGLERLRMGICTQLGAFCHFLVPLLLVGHRGTCILKQVHLQCLLWDLPVKRLMTQMKWWILVPSSCEAFRDIGLFTCVVHAACS